MPGLVTPPDFAIYNFVGSDPSVMYDEAEGIYKLWFNVGGADNFLDPSSGRVRIGYAESSDGLAWQLVSFPALDVGGDGTWDRTNVELPSVIKDDSLPDGHPRKYRMYYSGLDHALEQLPSDKILEIGMIYGIGLAFSADGKTFTRLPAAESPYGIEGLVLKPNPPQPEGDQWDLITVTDPAVVFVQGVYHLWYSSFSYDATAQQTYIAISYATSSDGIAYSIYGFWQKEPRIQPEICKFAPTN